MRSLKNYLTARQQRVVLNGKTSSRVKVTAVGSILGPLLFLIYRNDLPHEKKIIIKIFADDRSLFTFLEN